MFLLVFRRRVPCEGTNEKKVWFVLEEEVEARKGWLCPRWRCGVTDGRQRRAIPKRGDHRVFGRYGLVIRSCLREVWAGVMDARDVRVPSVETIVSSGGMGW